VAWPDGSFLTVSCFDIAVTASFNLSSVFFSPLLPRFNSFCDLYLFFCTFWALFGGESRRSGYDINVAQNTLLRDGKMSIPSVAAFF
jgi:hypothetical protein